jgi:DMSO/TMAO reductase YedYZ molybdopterin-dependent catalytic subunit
MDDLPLVTSPDTQRKNRVPPGQRLTEKWPVLHYGAIPSFDPAHWKFTLSGLIEAERVLSYTDLTSLPQVQVFSDIHCVTTWSRLNNLWQGVSAQEIGQLAQIRPEARFVIVHAAGRFTTNLTLDDFLQPDVLFAWKHDGQLISPEHGYPLRLVVPRLYFWKSGKWVTGIEFIAQDRPGFWESNGYHNHGDPWKEERYSP